MVFEAIPVAACSAGDVRTEVGLQSHILEVSDIPEVVHIESDSSCFVSVDESLLGLLLAVFGLVDEEEIDAGKC